MKIFTTLFIFLAGAFLFANNPAFSNFADCESNLKLKNYFQENNPAAPVGFIASGSIGENPVASGEVFLAVGPNDTEQADISYRLFYAETDMAVTDPTTEATEYTFGDTAGDGGGNTAFGFVLGGLEPATEYTFWLYQYDSANALFSEAAEATQTSGGDSTNPEDPDAPVVAAPAPTENEEDVISLFSNAYTNVTIDTWLTTWSSAQLEDLQIEGNDTKRYYELDFAGAEMINNPIDASEMDYLHLDVWSPNATEFKVKLVDLGGDAVEGELAFDINQGEWVSLEIPLEDFADATMVTDENNLLTVRNSIQQFIISGTPTGTLDVYVDNIYFGVTSDDPVEDMPATAAPTPTENEEDVISLFSNAYSNVTIDTWLTTWSSAQLEDLQIEGNDTKRYYDLDFAGAEMINNPIDASEMDYLHLDVWSPNATEFRVKLVDLGGDGVEGELAFEINQGEWVSLEIPLEDFADATMVTDENNLLTVRNSIQQFIISGNPTRV